MKIIDFSTPNLNPQFQIPDSKFRILEIVTATLIFVIPVLALFILAK